MNFDVDKSDWKQEILDLKRKTTRLPPGVASDDGVVERMLEEGKPEFLKQLKSAIQGLFNNMQADELYLEKVCYYVDWYIGWGDMIHGPGFIVTDPWLLSEIAKLPEPAKTVFMERYYPDRPSTLTCSKCGKIKLINERP